LSALLGEERTMRTREKNFVDIGKLKTIYSFQIHWNGKWCFPLVGDTLMKFETKQACDAARAEYRKKPTL
jgi:hypothetical protein